MQHSYLIPCEEDHCLLSFHANPKRYLVARRLYLPLSRGGTRVAVVLTAQTFHRPISADAYGRVTRTLDAG